MLIPSNNHESFKEVNRTNQQPLHAYFEDSFSDVAQIPLFHLSSYLSLRGNTFEPNTTLVRERERERENSELESLHIKTCLIFKKPVSLIQSQYEPQIWCHELESCEINRALQCTDLGNTALTFICIAICIWLKICWESQRVLTGLTKILFSNQKYLRNKNTLEQVMQSCRRG